MDGQEITGHTGLYCLIGSPVAHSVSPQMQNAAFQLCGMDNRYLAFDITKDTLPAAVEGLRAIGAKGWNVTMPCKQAIVPLCDKLTLNAELCNTVNTVRNENGKLIGTTTDGIGWVHSAAAAGHDIKGKHLVILGAGGAGTSIIVQCAIDGAKKIDVFKRKNATWNEVEAFIARVQERTTCDMALHDMGDLMLLKSCLSDADLLLNTTSIGMEGSEGCLIPENRYFHDRLVVSDVIYEPRETEMLRMAREAGLDTFNGMYMLLYQGAAAFRFWTGKDMPTEEIKKVYFAKRR